MKTYSIETINFYLNKKKKGLKVSLLSLILVIPLLIVFIIFVKLKTRVLFISLSTLVLSIYGIILTYNILENIIKSKDIIKHINTLLSGEIKEINGQILSISKPITLKRNIKVLEIEIKNDNYPIKAYYNYSLLDNDLNVGDNIKIHLSNNYIIDCEVKHE